MSNWRTDLVHRVLFGLALALAACASGGSGESRTVVPITDLGSVAGRWDGLLSGPWTPREQEDFVEVMIGADGTYQGRSVRTIGVLQGRGSVEVRDGALLFKGSRGTGTGRLFAVGGRRVLEIELTTPEGRAASARLSPKR